MASEKVMEVVVDGDGGGLQSPFSPSPSSPSGTSVARSGMVLYVSHETLEVEVEVEVNVVTPPLAALAEFHGPLCMWTAPRSSTCSRSVDPNKRLLSSKLSSPSTNSFGPPLCPPLSSTRARCSSSHVSLEQRTRCHTPWRAVRPRRRRKPAIAR